MFCKLSKIEGEKFRRVEVKETRGSDEWGGSRDISFLEISTDRDHVVVKNYNEHNGYYGGFSIDVTIRIEDDTEENKKELYLRTKYPHIFEGEKNISIWTISSERAK